MRMANQQLIDRHGEHNVTNSNANRRREERFTLKNDHIYWGFMFVVQSCALSRTKPNTWVLRSNQSDLTHAHTNKLTKFKPNTCPLYYRHNRIIDLVCVIWRPSPAKYSIWIYFSVCWRWVLGRACARLYYLHRGKLLHCSRQIYLFLFNNHNTFVHHIIDRV